MTVISMSKQLDVVNITASIGTQTQNESLTTFHFNYIVLIVSVLCKSSIIHTSYT